MAKRLAAMLLCACLALGMLAGCGGETEDNDSAPPEKDSSEEGTEGGEVSADTPSWKRDTTPITIDWFVVYDGATKVFDPVNNMADKKLVEETGITLNMITGSEEKLNALITSGELPDVVTCNATSTQRIMMENAGMVLSLDELAEKYAPDLNVPQSQKDWYRNEDGNWYSLISYYYGAERVNDEFGGYLAGHNMNFVRTDLLEQIGMTMEDLTTKEGFFEACKAIKDQNIQYNGMDVIPFLGANAEDFAYQFGVQLEDSEGNYLDIKTQPEYLEALKYLNKFYNEGLLPVDNFTMDTTKSNAYVSNGEVFMVHGWMNVNGIRDVLYANDPEAQLLYAGTIKTGDSGKQHYLAQTASTGWTASLISANTEYADRIISLFSYLTQEEITLDEQLGADCWEIVDGVAMRYPEKQEEYDADSSAYTEKYVMNLKYAVDWTIIQKYEDPNPEGVLEKDFLDAQHSQAAELFDSKCFLDIQPEGGTDLAAISANISEYWRTAETEMIMASSEEECEELYNQALEQIESMGYQELYEYWNERFQANKEKLGIEHAWPSLQ